MAEPSERDKRQAQELADGAHEAGLACGDCQDGANGYYICTAHLEPIARAIASAREEGDAAGFERGRRAGMEDVLARFEAIKAEHRATAARLREENRDDRSAWYWDEAAAQASDAAMVVRALIGGNE